jgi:hypothetical protein
VSPTEDVLTLEMFLEAVKKLEEASNYPASGQWFLPMSAYAYDSLKAQADWTIKNWANPLKRVWMWLRGYRESDVRWAHHLLEILGCHERVEYIRLEDVDVGYGQLIET